MSVIARQDAAAHCELAAALYLKVPSTELLNGLEELFAGREAFGRDSVDAIENEYRDLFFNPGSERFHCPFESFQREGRYWGEHAVAVGELYREAGFDPSSLQVEVHWKNQQMPDHIGFELAFLAAFLRSADLQTESEDDLLANARRFHQDHMMSWMKAYGEGLIEKGQTGLYHFLGRLTVEVTEFDLS